MGNLIVSYYYYINYMTVPLKCDGLVASHKVNIQQAWI